LHLALSAINRVANQLHHDLYQLLGRPVERFVQLLHHRLLLFLLLLRMSQIVRSLCRLALGHSALDISSGKNAGFCGLRRVSALGHGFSFLIEGGLRQPTGYGCVRFGVEASEDGLDTCDSA
jgi:hypothetical protein